MLKRYGHSGDPAGVWDLYRQAMAECYRVLRKRGILVVKCQDFIYGRTQYMSHVEIMNIAVGLGFYARDLFIYVAKTRPRAWNHQKQNHARKYHSYFWVFNKAKRTIPYSAPAYQIQGKCCHVHVVKGGSE
jgi:DNA modification methylase